MAKDRTLEKVQSTYSNYWDSTFKHLEMPREGGVALYTESGKPNRNNHKKFKGNCGYCRIQGHKQADCFKCKKAQEAKSTEGAKQEQGTKLPRENKKCFRCKQKGHIAKDCPTKKKNQADAFFIRMTLSDDEAEVEP